jgi:aspartyl aminopeptidase
LAIHLDPHVNEQALLLNKQEHLNALADINGHDFLIPQIKKIVPMKALISHDLYLAPLEKARLLANGTLLASHALDNLASCHAILEAFIPHKSRLNGAVFWDNEEIGSETSTGAASPFLEHTLERITASLGINREAHLRILSQSYLLSIDLAHAAHPNYLEKHDLSHRPILGQGPVLKWNANHRYATTGASAARLIEQANRLKVPFQTFVSRNDMPCGTTIGPISATRLGIMAADIGIPQLSMHGIREVISVEDYNNSVKLVQGLFEN